MNINFNANNFKWKQGQNPFDNFKNGAGTGAGSRPPRKGMKSPVARIVVSLIVTIVFALVYYYVAFPAINIHNGGFWFYILLLCAVYGGMFILTSGAQAVQGVTSTKGFVKKNLLVPVTIAVIVLVICVIGSVASWVVIRAGSYSKLLTVDTTGNFAVDVQELSFNQIPLLDSDSAMRLGNRKLGELSDMVSQFEVADDYTQINYKDKPVRVTPLLYGDIIKWFNNRSNGIPAYMIIDMTTSNVDVVRLSEGIKYTTAEHFNRLLYRYVQFKYPTYMFASPAFEIDDAGNPYWVCGKIEKTIGLFGGEDISGAVLVNAVTGETQYYNIDEVPSWVDRVYNADLITTQYDFFGRYHNGFINSVLGQKDVTVTTAGYNYIALNDDVYMYTGVTSVGGDESNVGFLLCNQRTKECKYYSCAGAEEFSAMESAQGIVQQMKYTATFPILLNVSGQPTYFMALKDSAGLVKQYAMVNMSQYQIVANGTTVQGCLATYLDLMRENGLVVTTVIEDVPEDSAEEQNTQTVAGVISEIRSAVVDGNTTYYITMNGEDYYSASAGSNPEAILLNVGDEIQIEFVSEPESVSNPVVAIEVTAKYVPAPPVKESAPEEELPAPAETEQQ